jgi:hypothetical protein
MFQYVQSPFLFPHREIAGLGVLVTGFGVSGEPACFVVSQGVSQVYRGSGFYGPKALFINPINWFFSCS